MIKILQTSNIPIKAWTNNLEEGAIKQAYNIAHLPFAFSHVALMPDCHQGYGMPIGGVLATKGAIVPNAVGMDIGCGMCAIKTSLTKTPDTNTLKKLMADIRKAIPLGHHHHKKPQENSLMPVPQHMVESGIVAQEFEAARSQIGTLGGGNHFIEIQKGSDGHIWIMVHSGSRNIGKKVATYYNMLAKKPLSKSKKKEAPKDLAHFNEGTKEFDDYFAEMTYCIDFAFANRKLMMARIMDVFNGCFGSEFQQLQYINIAHNYAAFETHYSQQVIVHRKGATRAELGETGIVPGSQGTSSYIVEGLGNKESFKSCSHGAGRKMGRRQAQRELNLTHTINSLNNKGVLHSIKTTNDLDEAPQAYKDIDEVMENQSDLIRIKIKLQPLAVIKG